MLRSESIKMYHVADIIEDLSLNDEEDAIAKMLSDTAIMLGEPIGMVPDGGMVITPKYFTLKTIFQTLNTNLLES